MHDEKKRTPPENRIKTEDALRLASKAIKAQNQQYDMSEDSAGAAMVTFSEYEEQVRQDKKKAGKAPKYCKGIYLATEDYFGEFPKASAREIWEMFPDAENAEIWESGDERWEVYRDGDRLVQRCDHTGQAREIGFETFRKDYLRKIKNSTPGG